MKRVLITGAGGQLGRELTRELAERGGYEVICTDVAELDITDRDAVMRKLSALSPAVVINTAAWTDVDGAEDHNDECRLLNAVAPGYLAEGAAACGGRMIHISTDYVFDGNAHRPYREDDPTNPLGVYGRTKLEGEERVGAVLGDDAMVIRTAWLYSPYGRNFVLTMLRLAAQGRNPGVVADQWGCPTSAAYLAGGIACALGSERWQGGTYHLTGRGRTTWYDFACAVFRLGGVKGVRVTPVTTAEYPATAGRPAYSVLDCSKFERTFGYEGVDWEESLRRFFQYSCS